MKYDVVFVVLTYKSSSDLQEFCGSLVKLKMNSKIIVVDAFYSEECSENIRKIAEKYQADYMDIENKGYSYGNNRGLEYAIKNYEFDYAVVSNPDIVIKKFDIEKLDNDYAVYGPLIHTMSGKRQNPFRWKYFPMGEYIAYKGYKENISQGVWFNIGINKVLREMFFLLEKISGKESYKVYSLHGSFMIFPERVVKTFFPIYFEKMFMFTEEDYVAHRMKKNGIPMFYTKAVEVLHKEDGSVGISKIDTKGITKNSYISYYENKKNIRKIM